MPLRTVRFATPCWLLAAVLILTAIVYLPGLHGPFTFDDEPNITKNSAVQVVHLTPDTLTSAAFSHGSGQRPLSMLTVALNHAFSGQDPFPYKITNLAIHLTNGLLLFALVRLLLQTPLTRSQGSDTAKWVEWIPLLVAAAWLLHPLNVTSVLYVIQRMTSLSALFCLAGMLLYTLGRLRLMRGERGGVALILAAVFVATPLAFLSKENGILLPAYLFLIEWLLFGFAPDSIKIRRGLILLFLLIVGIPAVLAAGFLLTHPDWITGGYANRSFTLEERALTQPRVLWLYLKLLILPRPSELSLFHDDLPLSTGLFTPWTTLPALLGLAGLALGALVFRRRWPLAAFGVLFFLAGHLLESSVFALEMTHEHRNYLPGIGILLALIAVAIGWRPNAKVRRLGMAAILVLIALYAAMTAMRAAVWSNAYTLALTGVTDHPQSNRWQQQMGQMVWAVHEATTDPDERTALYQSARKHFLYAAALDARSAPGNLFSLLQIDSAANQPTDPQIIDDLMTRLPHGPIAAFTVTSFVTLIECQAGVFCVRPIVDIERLLAAILENPKLRPSHRGKLLAAASQYAINRLGLEQALNYAHAAIKADPTELQHALNYAQLLIYAGRTDEATTQLHDAKERDSRNVYQRNREQLEQQLATGSLAPAL